MHPSPPPPPPHAPTPPRPHARGPPTPEARLAGPTPRSRSSTIPDGIVLNPGVCGSGRRARGCADIPPARVRDGRMPDRWRRRRRPAGPGPGPAGPLPRRVPCSSSNSRRRQGPRGGVRDRGGRAEASCGCRPPGTSHFRSGPGSPSSPPSRRCPDPVRTHDGAERGPARTVPARTCGSAHCGVSRPPTSGTGCRRPAGAPPCAAGHRAGRRRCRCVRSRSPGSGCRGSALCGFGGNACLLAVRQPRPCSTGRQDTGSPVATYGKGGIFRKPATCGRYPEWRTAPDAVDVSAMMRKDVCQGRYRHNPVVWIPRRAAMKSCRVS